MRILHLLNHIQNIGNGIVNVATDLACLQSKAGHAVAIASSQAAIDEQSDIKTYKTLLTRHGVHCYDLDQTRTPLNLLRSAGQYRQIIHDFQPDIVHTHMMTGVVLAKVLRLGAPYRLISTVHNEFQRSAMLMGLADQIITVSHAVATAMHQRGIPQPKLTTIHNGTIGSPRQRPLQSYEPLPLARPAITTVAGLYPRKGISDLIEGFNQVAATSLAHLYIVGHGPSKAQFEAQAKSSPFASRIHFEGFQPEPQRYLRSTDIFVLASRKDPCPLVLAEAREAGCAIVASRVDGIPEALDDGAAGLLTAPEDSDSIATALRQLLEDADSLERWRSQAQQNLEHLNVERMNSETLALYDSALKNALTSHKAIL